MRIIGRLPHPTLQITVFSNDGRFPVQFELHGLTQQYRFRHGPGLRNLADVQRLIDADFQARVLSIFESMRTAQSRILKDHLSQPEEDEFPEIL